MLPFRTALSLVACLLFSIACQPRPQARSYQVHGMIFYDATGHRDTGGPAGDNQTRKGFGHVAVPDVTVELRRPGSSEVVVTGVSDLEGHFRLSEAAEGRYDLCWKGDGWLSQCLPDLIEIQGHAFYAERIFIQPDSKAHPTGAFAVVGDVRFADSSLCRLVDTTRGIDLTATVILAAGGPPLKKVRANAFGDFVVPDVPAGTAASLSASCDDLKEAEAQAKMAAWQAGAGATSLVMGDFAAFGAADAAAPALSTAGVPVKHLRLQGQPPRLAGFVIRGADNRVVSRAAAGETVTVSAQTLAGGSPVLFWQASGGALAASGPDSLKWSLPAELGQYQIELLVADGAGGWSRQTRAIHVTNDLRPAFSGRVRTNDGGALAAANARVDVNGKPIPLDANGFFYGRIDPAADARYVLNVNGDGYLPVSVVYHRESSGATYLLERVQTIPFNAGTGQTLSFPPPLKRQGEPGRQKATLEISGGSLRNAGGIYNGPATASGAYIDPSQRSLPGDYDGLSPGGEDQSLISYGALYVTLKDGGGQPLQLVDGATAKLRIPFPADRNPATAPPTMPVWYYDPLDGYWRRDLQAVRDGDAYVADIKHFSTINMDEGTVGNAVCIRVEVDFLKTPQDRILKATMTLPGGGTQVKQATLDVQLNAVYRLLPDEDVTFDILRADGSDYPEFVLKDRRNGDAEVPSKTLSLVAADKMDGVDLWPDEPYTDCKPHVLVTGDIDAPASFYHRKGADAADPDAAGRAAAYYQVMDPNGDRTTLADWLDVNDFQPVAEVGGGFSFPPAAQVVSVAYLNHGDLGSGRKMHCRKDGNRVACFVDNYAADNNLANSFNGDPAGAVVAQQAKSGTGFATVAMEYAAVEGVASLSNYGFGNAKVVKFFTFGGGGGRVTQAALDKVSGNRWQPNVCMVCHGGNFPSTFVVKDAGGNEIPGGGPFPTSAAAVNALSADQKAGVVAAFKTEPSSFREFDLGNLSNLQGTNPENKMKQLNCNYVRHTEPNSEITNIIATWYASAACTEAGSATQIEYIPASFAAHAAIYRDVTSQVCRTCHIAQTGYEADDHDSNLKPWSSMTSPAPSFPYTCSTNMPQAFIPYHAYWMEGMHGKVLAKYGADDCP